MNLLLRLLINAAALWAAGELVSGVTLTGSLMGILLVALVFGLINAHIKPLLVLLALPGIVLTLGLLTLVINALMLLLTDAITPYLTVTGFGAAFWGSIVISLVSFLLSMFLDDA